MVLGKYYRLVRIIAVSLLLPFSISCATFLNGTTQGITFNSNKAGIYVTVLNDSGQCVFSGRTPCKARLERGAGYFKSGAYEIYYEEKPGYCKVKYPGIIRGKVDLFSYLLMNVTSGFIGYLIVDPSTGAMWVLNPDDVQIYIPKKQIDNSNSR